MSYLSIVLDKLAKFFTGIRLVRPIETDGDNNLYSDKTISTQQIYINCRLTNRHAMQFLQCRRRPLKV